MPDDNKVALITGSGHGIGKAAALRLAGRGWTVAINDLKPEFVDEAVAEVEAAGGKAIPVVRNVGSREGVHAAVDTVMAQAGRLDGFVNNAAWVRYQAIPDIAPETLYMAAVGLILRASTKPIPSGPGEPARRCRDEVVNIWRCLTVVAVVPWYFKSFEA